MEISELLSLAKDSKGPGDWTASSLIRVGGILASKINGIQNISGPEKLKLVQRILLQLLAETENKEIAEPELSKEAIQAIHDRYDTLEAVVADAVPASLELAIKAARGGLDLKKVKLSTWVKMCSCFATGVVHQLASMHLISEAHATQARRAIGVASEKAKAAAEAKEEAAPAPAPPKEEAPKESVKAEPVEEKKEEKISEAAPVSEDTAQ